VKTIIAILVLFSSTCFAEHKSGSIEKHTKKLEKFVTNNDWFQHGVWIEVKNSSGWEKTALIFAYGEWGNWDECYNIISETYPLLLATNKVRCKSVK
jgi:hypothetical protein|tara:strand:+ start:696 stop:986 length:291 start_codon:yes stop_codon:yes gene_type:complete